jgi:hypothetical protein
MAHPEVLVPDDELNEVASHDSVALKTISTTSGPAVSMIVVSSIRQPLVYGMVPTATSPYIVRITPCSTPAQAATITPAVQQADRHSTRLGGPRPRWTVCTGVTKICGCVYRIQSCDPSAEAKKALSALVRRVLLNTAPVLNPNTIARTTKT